MSSEKLFRGKAAEKDSSAAPCPARNRDDSKGFCLSDWNFLADVAVHRAGGTTP